MKWRSAAALLLCSAGLSSFGGCTVDETTSDSDKSSDDGNDDGADEGNGGSDDGADDSDDSAQGSKDAGKPSKDAGTDASKDAGKDASKPATDASTGSDTGSKSDAGSEGDTSSLWCQAKAVLDPACASCHGKVPAAGAPMSLVTFEDYTAAAPNSAGKKVWEAVSARVHDAKNPMPPGKPLSADKLAIIDAWIKDGAKPGSDPTCSGTKTTTPTNPSKPSTSWPPPGSEKCYRLTVDNDGKGTKLKVPAGAQPHPQVILDAPWGDEDVQAVGFKPITDNSKILHHWIVYQNSGGMAFITGWAPGQDESELEKLPDDVGVYLPKGPKSLRLDMHYNNKTSGAKDEIDASGVEVCVTKPRKYAATTYMGFSQFLISLPPNKKTDVVGKCNVRTTQPVFLLSQSPHAHQLAYHMKFELTRGGQTTTLHDGAFAFDGQVATPFEKPVEIKTGDVITTTCSFNNTTNRTVTFGENTGNEMCFNFATYYPKGALSCALF